jgi:hypothetical protein
LILGAEAIGTTRIPRTKIIGSTTNKRHNARKARTSVEVPSSTGDMVFLDSPAEPIGEKSKICGRKSHLKFKRPFPHKKSPNLNVMAGEYAPVLDLVKGFQNSDDSIHISDDLALSPIKIRPGRRLIEPRNFMTPEGEEMQAIDEHEDEQAIDEQEDEQAIDEQEDEQAIDEQEDEQAIDEQEDEQAIDEQEDEQASDEQEDEQASDEQEDEQAIGEQEDFQSSSFGDGSPNSRVLKRAIYPNNQAPDVRVKN